MKIDYNSQFNSNLGVMSERDLIVLSNTKVIIVGLGGLGGNIANNLARLGVGSFLLVDFDKFQLTNLNRQLFSTHENIDSYKAKIVKNELLKINPQCKIDISINKIEDISIDDLNGYDYIIDAVDAPQTKIFLSVVSTLLNIPLLHGACAGWYGQVGWMLPGCKLIDELYGSKEYGLEKELLNPSFTPSVIAGIMSSEFLKFIQKDNNTIINQLLLIDLLTNSIMKSGNDDG